VSFVASLTKCKEKAARRAIAVHLPVLLLFLYKKHFLILEADCRDNQNMVQSAKIFAPAKEK